MIYFPPETQPVSTAILCCLTFLVGWIMGRVRERNKRDGRYAYPFWVVFLILVALLLSGCGSKDGDEDQNPYDGTTVTAWTDPYDDSDPFEITIYSTVTYGHQYDIDILVKNETSYVMERAIDIATRTWSATAYIYLLPGERVRVHIVRTSSMFVSPRLLRSYDLAVEFMRSNG